MGITSSGCTPAAPSIARRRFSSACHGYADRMDLSDLASYVHPIEPTLSVYLAVEGEQPVDAVLSVAFSAFEPPSWFDRAELVTAIESARHADAAGVAWFQRAGEPPFAAPLADPPRQDLVTVAPLPVMVPLIETLHRTLDHLLVTSTLDSRTNLDEVPAIHLVHVPPERQGTTERCALPSSDPLAIAETIVSRVPASAEMVLLALPDGLVEAVADRVAEALGPRVAVARLDPYGDLAEQSVRSVADRAASETVRTLQMFRFLESHGSVAQGLPAVAEALSRGRARRLLLGLGFEPETSVHVEEEGVGVQLEAGPGGRWRSVSAPDGLVRSALLQSADVRIIPEHVHDGPAEGVGVLLDDAT